MRQVYRSPSSETKSDARLKKEQHCNRPALAVRLEVCILLQEQGRMVLVPRITVPAMQGQIDPMISAPFQCGRNHTSDHQ